MKAITKDEVNRRVSLYKLATLKPVVHKEFNKVLTITIPGHPISDSRPRDGKFKNKYNPHKANLMAIMRSILKVDPILSQLTIFFHHIIHIDFYTKLPKKYMKILTTEERKLYDDGTGIVSIFKKDIDNVEKVNYDVLQDTDIQIILDDKSTVGNKTRKWYADEERTVIKIFYQTDVKKIPYYIYNDITNSIEYIYYKLYNKYKVRNNMSDNMWAIHFIKTINELVIKHQTKHKSIFKRIKKIVNTLGKPQVLMLCDIAYGKNHDNHDKIVKAELINKLEKYLEYNIIIKHKKKGRK